MKFFVTDSLEHAEVLNAIAFEHLKETQGVNGTQWSEIYVDYQGSTKRFAILWDECLSGLFTQEEIEANVVDGEILVRDEGRYVSGNWEVVKPESSDETV